MMIVWLHGDQAGGRGHGAKAVRNGARRNRRLRSQAHGGAFDRDCLVAVAGTVGDDAPMLRDVFPVRLVFT